MVGDTAGLPYLRRVTLGAQRSLRDVAQVKVMRRVAIGAHGLGSVEGAFGAGFLVAVRAPQRELSSPTRVRIVAGDAVRFVLFDRMRRGDLFMTAHTSAVAGGTNCMRIVTATAIAVLARRSSSKDGCAFVAAFAAGCAGRRKRVWLVAVDAGAVAVGGTSKDGGARNSRRRLVVALHTRCCLGGELMTPVAVGTGAAQLRSAVLDPQRFVAVAALSNRLLGR